jgi:electron transfer flavoprotein alpha subunit
MILIVGDQVDGRLLERTARAVTAGQHLADHLDGNLCGLLIGPGSENAGAAFARLVPRVITVSAPSLEEFRVEPWTTVVADVARREVATAVVLPDTRAAASLAPRVAMRLGMPLLEGVVGFDTLDGDLVARRFSHLNRVVQTLRPRSLPLAVTVSLDAFPPSPERANGGRVESTAVEVPAQDLRVRIVDQTISQQSSERGARTRVVVAGGRGVGGPEGFRDLVEPLAHVLSAEVGTTRPPVDARWRPYSEQIGQTGKTVAPDLYIALGISGAMQHVSGMNRSKVVVAVNKNPDAPIFRSTDYGIVGDVRAVAPALISALRDVLVRNPRSPDPSGPNP